MDELQIFDFERDFAGSAIAIASYWSACHAKCQMKSQTAERF